jgi:hypothetical protein
MNSNKVIYSICVSDIQTVAQETKGRKLTEAEISAVSDKIGDYIDWYQAIENALSDCFFEIG